MNNLDNSSKQEKKKMFISTISGGKDSVAMTDLLLKNGYPVDLIIHCDTGVEYDEMNEYMIEVQKYFKEVYNREVIMLNPNNGKTFEDWLFGGMKRGKNKGTIRGFPLVSGICYWTREAKIRPVEKFLKKYEKDYEIFTYLGITIDEVQRKQDHPNKIYPLIDYFNMSENDCLEYTKKINLFNPLYEHFTRTGCFLCPKQGKKNLKKMIKHHPQNWEKIKSLQNKLLEISKEQKVFNPYFKFNVDLEEFENKVKKELEEERKQEQEKTKNDNQEKTW